MSSSFAPPERHAAARQPRQLRVLSARAEPAASDSTESITAGGDSMSRLRYLAAPIQREPAMLNGISARENAAVAALSGGQVNLHELGARVERVAPSDARLQAVGARSLAQGRQALVSHEADRGHELWHLAQQAMGRVSANTTLGGQPANTQAGHEQEADRMGAAIAQYAGPEIAAPASAPRIAVHAPLQRRVDDFEAETKSYVPPTRDLLNTIKYKYFTQSEKTVRSKIETRLTDTKASNTKVPTHIDATLAAAKKGDETPARKAHKSGMVGKFGINEFFLRSGGTPEVFEGGHIIPHEVWATVDSDVASADDYVNLVPMSRTMNVGAEESWRVVERKILDSYESLKGSATFSVSIDIKHEPYELSYAELAERFGLTVAGGRDGKDKVRLYGWLPTQIKADDTSSKKPKTIGLVTENQLHNTSIPITTGSELVTALKGTPLWLRMSEALRDDVEDL